MTRYESEEEFPHGPRNLEEEEAAATVTPSLSPSGSPSSSGRRKRRSVVVSDRKVRSADVGVSGIYEVISEADLAFSPDSHAEAVTVFQGRIHEEVVYGICLPMSGFSALFIVVALSAVVSALVAGAMLHRLQTQRELSTAIRKNGTGPTGFITSGSGGGWLSYGLLRVRCADRPSQQEQQQQTAGTATTSPVQQG